MADFLLGRLKFVWQGAWTTGTSYLKDDIVSKDGTSWVCLTPHTANANFYTDRDSSYWNKMANGLNWLGAWSGSTTYQTNSIVTYGGNSWISTADNNLNGTPGVSGNWATFVSGSLDDVLTTKGDVPYRGTSSTTRLPIGTTGQALTVSSSGIPAWASVDGVVGAVYYVSTSGSDSNNGTSLNRPFLTLRYACSQVTGPATIFVKSGTYNEQLPITVPAGVGIIGDSMRDTNIAPLVGSTTSTYVPTGSSGTTLKVLSNTGIYAGMTVTGTGIGSGRTVISTSSTDTVILSQAPSGTPSGTLTFQYLSTDASPVANNLSTMFYLSDSTMLQQLLLTGMTGFSFSGAAPTDITQATIGGVYMRLNPATTITIKSPYIKDCTAKSSGGIGAIVNGTDQTGGIKSMVFWAYNMVLDGGVGIWCANGGKAEAVSCFTYYAYMGYTTSGGGLIRSIAGNNSYGTYGVVSAGYLASETPVTGTVYGNMLTIQAATQTGTFQQSEVIRQLNTSGSINITSATCSGTTATVNYTNQGSAPFSTGQYITVANVGAVSGYNITAQVITSTATSTTYTVSPGSLSNGTPSTGTITGNASAYVTSVQTGYLYFKQSFGTFNTTNQVTGVTSGATMTPSAVGGQNNYLIVLSSLSASPGVGASIQFSGDTNAYVISAVSTATVNSVAITIITMAQQKVATSTDGTAATIRYNFSLIRLQSHDFLSIGTGGATTTNYPGIPTQSAAPANQIVYTFPGRVYYVATDELGNFNVGAYFSVNQATGSATLNASAFNLSGLTSLRLGSIGAQLGAQINEFSTDGTLSQNSDVKVPTQHAVTTYLGASYQTFAPATDLGYDLGTPTKRWGHLYVGPGSITLGTVTLTDNSGTLAVSSTGSGNMTIPGNLTVTGTTTLNGATTYVQGNNTVYTDNLLELHAPTGGVGGTWGSSDGKDIGLRMHYYSAGDQNAALLLANDSGYLEWYNTGTENGSGDFVSASYGTIKAATFLATTSITTSNTSFSIAPTTATTLNIGTVATTVNVASGAAGASTLSLGATSYNNILTINGNGTGGTATINSNVTSGTVSLFATTSGTIQIGTTGINVGIGTNGQINTGFTNALNVNGGIVAGNAGSTAGSIILQGYYGSNGALTNFGTENSSGGPSIGYCMYPAGTQGTFNSSTGVAGLSRGGYTINASGHIWYSGSAQTVAIGSAVTVTNTMSLSSSGVLTTTGGFVESSSITLKENINPITNALDAITSLVGVIYDRKDGSKKNEPGLIAEAVNKVIPNLVSKDENGNAEGIYYSKLTAYLVEAIKDLKSQIDPLKEEIRKLKGE